MFEIITSARLGPGQTGVFTYATAEAAYVELGRLAERYEMAVHIDLGLNDHHPNSYATVHAIDEDPVLTAIAVVRWVSESA